MKRSEIEALTSKTWIEQFNEMPGPALNAEIARRKGGQWYCLADGELFLGRDYGPRLVPSSHKLDWPAALPPDYLLDTDSFPDWAHNSNAAIQLALELRAEYGDPYRLNRETDPDGCQRWLAIFRKSYAYAWGDTPSEALCRAYLMAYELLRE